MPCFADCRSCSRPGPAPAPSADSASTTALEHQPNQVLLAPVPDRRDVPRRFGALLEEDAKTVVVQDRCLDLHGLVVLVAGVGSHHDEAGLLRDRPGDLAAAVLDRCDGLVAAVVAQ